MLYTLAATFDIPRPEDKNWTAEHLAYFKGGCLPSSEVPLT